jgi:hypothetical protein
MGQLLCGMENVPSTNNDTLQEPPLYRAPDVPISTSLVHLQNTLDIANIPNSTFFMDLRSLYMQDIYGVRTQYPKFYTIEFQRNMNSLLQSGSQADVSLDFGQDRIVPVHKAILSARSQYFSNMFNSQMVESQQTIIQMEEEIYEPMLALLQYFYCDYIDLSKYNLIELYVNVFIHLPLVYTSLESMLQNKKGLL